MRKQAHAATISPGTSSSTTGTKKTINDNVPDVDYLDIPAFSPPSRARGNFIE